MSCDHETCDESICLQPGYRIVENGECGAQLEIEDCELRASMARNIAHALHRERIQAFKQAAEVIRLCNDRVWDGCTLNYRDIRNLLTGLRDSFLALAEKKDGSEK
jgi:hypothetical protein